LRKEIKALVVSSRSQPACRVPADSSRPRKGNVCLSIASWVVKEETQDNGKAKASLDVNLAIIVTNNDIPTLVGKCLATSLWVPVFSWKPLTGSAAAVNDILGIGSDLGTWWTD
jgi:hypothetical protein